MFTRKTMDIDGELISYIEENNDKPKILFLHGFASSSEAAQQVYNLTNRSYGIIALDFPGCGHSSAKKDINIEYYQFIAKRFVEELNLKDFIVIGHSLGGASALHLLNEKLAKKAILAAPINYDMLHSTNQKVKLKWLLPENLQQAYESVDSLVFVDRLNYKQNLDKTAQRFFNFMSIRKPVFLDMVVNQILNPDYLKNSIKNLYLANNDYEFIIGEKDLFVTYNSILSVALENHKKINSIPDCGHALFFEKPEEVNQIIEDIIKQVN
ncbi:alpha/beta fold hydrolase [Mesomycoplasma hyorhinis]|uniref:alpha/beta fold hydrolase n=1 Tax=Mesomycoplasma hyorhinis TaxID=2100 RepID=UPI0003622B87|nr:alpha/beta hydrolase [Mesomycoplasma hyorhinis]QPC29738.1 alpha/beta hydrolase [Mesomycoplasma hyorhinis]UVT32388.1 alpha/beta hydrolase [Mesomycoplasma hyorhinis]UVT33068.1 alpha/beta hydrolase [Mesomycoplasma hyorhinis]UVT33741.1 alpha/beta hydrolase [Mesomycoplasma hyorhinis]UVT34464.1 alpha/beta hydrolase [Mesomycoplasma hyorhinis]